MPWETSNRPAHPKGWKALRQTVLTEAGNQCEAPNCMNQATVVDHIVNLASGGSHERNNLQALCPPCHTVKTAGEARQARTYLTTRRPKQKHPGIK